MQRAPAPRAAARRASWWSSSRTVGRRRRRIGRSVVGCRRRRARARARGAARRRRRLSRSASARAAAASRACVERPLPVALLVLLLLALLLGEQRLADRRAVGDLELLDEPGVRFAVRAEAVALPRRRAREHLAGVRDAVEVVPVVRVGRRPLGAAQPGTRAGGSQQRAGGHDRVEVVVDRGVVLRAVRVALRAACRRGTPGGSAPTC